MEASRPTTSNNNHKKRGGGMEDIPSSRSRSKIRAIDTSIRPPYRHSFPLVGVFVYYLFSPRCSFSFATSQCRVPTWNLCNSWLLLLLLASSNLVIIAVACILESNIFFKVPIDTHSGSRHSQRNILLTHLYPYHLWQEGQLYPPDRVPIMGIVHFPGDPGLLQHHRVLGPEL